jgi:hypothetical protein
MYALCSFFVAQINKEDRIHLFDVETRVVLPYLKKRALYLYKQ